MAWRGTAGLGPAWHGMAGLGKARHGEARYHSHCLNFDIKAWQGLARQGVAGQGKARRGKARKFSLSLKKAYNSK